MVMLVDYQNIMLDFNECLTFKTMERTLMQSSRSWQCLVPYLIKSTLI